MTKNTAHTPFAGRLHLSVLTMVSIFQFLLLALAISFSQQACPDGWRPSAINGTKCYRVVVNRRIWFDANTYCGTLAQTACLTSVTSGFENSFLNAIVIDTPSVSSCDQFWIGANDFENSGQFVWWDDASFHYTNWGSDQPDLTQQCVSSLARTTGKWKTEACGTENCFICEVFTNSTGSTSPPTSTTATITTTTTLTTTTTTTTPTSTYTTTPPRTMTDCYDWLYYGGASVSGVYMIQPTGFAPFPVYCDMTTNGGGWTVFQRRLDGTLPFYNQTWANYKLGFGAPTGNHWLGNDKIHALTTKDSTVNLRIEIRGDRCQQPTFPGVCASPALMDRDISIFGEFWFHIDDESSRYTMHTSDIITGNMTSPGKDGFKNSDGKMFATVDQPNGSSLIGTDQIGAWWFDQGIYCALNGKYNHDGPSTWGMYFDRKYGVVDYDIIPVSTEMKLRRA